MFSANRIIGLILIALSTYIWLTANTFPTPSQVGPGPAFFPRIVAIIIALLATILILKRDDRQDNNTMEKTAILKIGMGMIIVIIYVVSIQWVGFGVMTFLFFTVMMWLLQVKKWTMILLTSSLISITIIFVFEYLLGVPIPHGWLF
ncbi:tripartite tricarboxylate transporter TctB family protein [Caldalkalibacillus salinus]|uniref:tripartite tricarboxylate transporter TctB family protein n=1 Tax=Caldalkalibacillus salinus TaxID=2803787 RepID=UPI001923BEF3|nr:tripartite tricarboxylate transporter TctB family protein [Caldalkalibacillus salinus]